MNARTTKKFIDCEIVACAKYDYSGLAFAVQKNSPYYGLFNYHMKKMKETGILDQILSKYEISRRQICPDYSGQALGMNSTFTGNKY